LLLGAAAQDCDLVAEADLLERPEGSTASVRQIKPNMSTLTPDLPGRYVVVVRASSGDTVFAREQIEIDATDVPALAPLASVGFACTDLEIWNERIACARGRCESGCPQGTDVFRLEGGSLRVDARLDAPAGWGLAVLGEHLITAGPGAALRAFANADLAEPVAALDLDAAPNDLAPGGPGRFYATDFESGVRALQFDGARISLTWSAATRFGSGGERVTPVHAGNAVLVHGAGQVNALSPVDGRPTRLSVASRGASAIAPAGGDLFAQAGEGGVALLQFVEGQEARIVAQYPFGAFQRVGVSGDHVVALGSAGMLVLLRDGAALVPIATDSPVENMSFPSAEAVAFSGNRIAVARGSIVAGAGRTAIYELP
jgi:hypothetical protein